MATSVTESPYWVVAGWTMLHFLWVGGLIGLTAAGGRLALSAARPVVRYNFALVCLGALAAAPLVIAGNLLQDESRIRAAGPPVLPLELPMVSGFEPAPEARPAAPAAGTRSRTVFSTVLLSHLESSMNRAAGYLPWAWLIGTPLVFVLVAGGLAGAEQLRHKTHLLTAHPVNRRCCELRRELRLTREVAVGICDRVASPVLIGILRPAILLPPAALVGLSADQLEMVLIHELAHVRRWDNLINLLQRIIESILFFHPVVWIVSRWARREREHCCDEVVLHRTGRPRAYAEMLAAMLEPATPTLAAVGMGEANIVKRIRHVLRFPEESMRPSHRVMGLLMSGFITTAILLGLTSRPSAAKPMDLNAALLIEQQLVESPAPPPTIAAGPQAPAGRDSRATPGADGADVSPEQTVAEADASALADRLSKQQVVGMPIPIDPNNAFTLLLLDQQGLPVEGARVALRTRKSPCGIQYFCRRSEPQHIVSGHDGRVVLPTAWFAKPPTPNGYPVYAIHEQRQISGIQLIGPDNRGRELSLALQPPCRVRFRLDSPALTAMGFPLTAAKGHLLVDGYDEVPVFEHIQTNPNATGEPYDFDYSLPPGKYYVYAYSDLPGRPETDHLFVPFEVSIGQTQLDLGTLDLPVTRYSTYYGQPAPEFVGVTTIPDKRPVSLADYRGKLLLVYFAPATANCFTDCFRQLCRKYKPHGLEGIAIHSPAAPDADPRQLPNEPFVDAWDGPGWININIAGTTYRLHGGTAAAYGLESQVVTFLIDKEGRLLQRVRLDEAETRAVIERELGLNR